MRKALRALIVEDRPDDAELLLRELRRNGYEVWYRRVQTADAMRAALAAEPWDVIVSDYSMPEFSGLAALAVARESGIEIPFIIVSGTIGEETAVEALRAGAHDFLVKGRLARLAPAIERELRESSRRRERRETLAQLEERGRHLDAIFNQLAVGMVETDLEGRLVSANQRFCDIIGRPLAEVLGRRIHDLIHPQDNATHAGGDIDPTVEERFRRPDGSDVWVHSTTSIVADQDGQPAYAVAIVQDVTERKRAETLRQRGFELEAENRRVQEGSRIKSEFLANMSHELRTPLNSIIGFSELMHDGLVGKISPEHKDFLGDVLTSARHLLQLINDVLDLSKVEAGKLEFHPEVVDVGRVVGEVAGILRSVAAVQHVLLVTAVDPALGWVTIDAARFKQVLYNYISNALKFTPEGGRVTVRARAEDATTFRLEVEDTGVGISPADVARLFVEFQQIETGPTHKHTGTGLGLSLTKRLVEKQGGTVGVSSTPGQGSTFWALLPRESRSGVPLPQPRFVPGPRADSPVVLVVEDDAGDQALLVQSLADAGYAVETAATRAQAIGLCGERGYDAIMLDLLLPDANGLKLLEEIRTGSRNADVPVIVVSVVANEKLAAAFAVHDALSKPLHRERLLRSLQRAGVPPDREGRILVVDDDPGSLQLMETTLRELGYRTTCVHEAQEGLEAARTSRPLAVVLDLMMPEMNGFEFLDVYRRTPANRDVPVIIWTMKELSPEDERVLRASAQSVVKKEGVGSATLVEVLRAHCRSTAATVIPSRQ